MKEQTNGERFEEFMNSIDNYPELEGTINLSNDMINKRKTGKMTEEEWVAAEKSSMTSIEWLIKKITNRQNGIFDGFPHLSLDEIYDKAKEMHRKEIIDAYFEGDESGFKEPAEKYYNETYKQDV